MPSSSANLMVFGSIYEDRSHHTGQNAHNQNIYFSDGYKYTWQSAYNKFIKDAKSTLVRNWATNIRQLRDFANLMEDELKSTLPKGLTVEQINAFIQNQGQYIERWLIDFIISYVNSKDINNDIEKAFSKKVSNLTKTYSNNEQKLNILKWAFGDFSNENARKETLEWISIFMNNANLSTLKISKPSDAAEIVAPIIVRLAEIFYKNSDKIVSSSVVGALSKITMKTTTPSNPKDGIIINFSRIGQNTYTANDINRMGIGIAGKERKADSYLDNLYLSVKAIDTKVNNKNGNLTYDAFLGNKRDTRIKIQDSSNPFEFFNTWLINNLDKTMAQIIKNQKTIDIVNYLLNMEYFRQAKIKEPKTNVQYGDEMGKIEDELGSIFSLYAPVFLLFTGINGKDNFFNELEQLYKSTKGFIPTVLYIAKIGLLPMHLLIRGLIPRIQKFKDGVQKENLHLDFTVNSGGYSPNFGIYKIDKITNAEYKRSIALGENIFSKNAKENLLARGDVFNKATRISFKLNFQNFIIPYKELV